jgi:ATPase subunit of ABC transporter with duplicated ATPase domains
MTVMDAKSYWGWGWGAKGKRAQASAFFDGEHLVKHLFESSFGRFMAVVEKLSKDGGARPRVEESSFRLPRVVVVGAESAGKSSLLESLTKAAIFPRDAKTCTKMPIRVCLGRLIRSWREQATVTAGGQSWHVPKEQILERVSEVMADGAGRAERGRDRGDGPRRGLPDLRAHRSAR